MRLENLYENFGLATPEIQAQYITDYRLRRAEDMAKPSTWPKKKKTAKKASKAKIVLTEEEETLMKLLGLKKKDVVALRALGEE